MGVINERRANKEQIRSFSRINKPALPSISPWGTSFEKHPALNKLIELEIGSAFTQLSLLVSTFSSHQIVALQTSQSEAFFRGSLKARCLLDPQQTRLRSDLNLKIPERRGNLGWKSRAKAGKITCILYLNVITAVTSIILAPTSAWQRANGGYTWGGKWSTHNAAKTAKSLSQRLFREMPQLSQNSKVHLFHKTCSRETEKWPQKSSFSGSTQNNLTWKGKASSVSAAGTKNAVECVTVPPVQGQFTQNTSTLTHIADICSCQLNEILARRCLSCPCWFLWISPC